MMIIYLWSSLFCNRRNIMRKILAILALALTFIASGNAVAKKAGGGFQGPGVANATVAEALKMSDDTPVVLRGKIEKSLGDEKYQFNDGTGIIVVEIDDDEWNGVVVKPENTVELRGEIDKDMMQAPEVDVNVVILVE